KEAGALSKHVVAAKQSSTSELVRELADVRGAGFRPHLIAGQGRARDPRGIAIGEDHARIEGTGRVGALSAVRRRGGSVRGGRRPGRGAGRERRDRKGQVRDRVAGGAAGGSRLY